MLPSLSNYYSPYSQVNNQLYWLQSAATSAATGYLQCTCGHNQHNVLIVLFTLLN